MIGEPVHPPKIIYAAHLFNKEPDEIDNSQLCEQLFLIDKAVDKALRLLKIRMRSAENNFEYINLVFESFTELDLILKRYIYNLQIELVNTPNFQELALEQYKNKVEEIIELVLSALIQTNIIISAHSSHHMSEECLTYDSILDEFESTFLSLQKVFKS